MRKYNQDTGCLQKKDRVDKDRNLVEMIYTMLKSIPDVMWKALLWLELQQKIIPVKYSGYQVVPSSVVPVAPHLHQVPQTSANNFFGFMSPQSLPSPSETSFSSTSPCHLFFWVVRDKLGNDRRFLYILKYFEKRKKEKQKQCNSLSFSNSSFF